ncbi:MAG: hypothetical protein ACRD6X_01140 [Pyrinomonadaceae bacterium]
MFKKHLIIMLIVGLLNLLFASAAAAGTNDAKRKAVAAKVKASITKLGTGPNAKVEVKLYDKTKIKGYISQITDDGFVVVDSNSNLQTEVPYSNAKQVRGNNLSTGVKILIGVGIIIAAAILIGLFVGD